MTHISCFYAQGEAAQVWLDIFNEFGAVKLIETLAEGNLIDPVCGEAEGPLSPHLDHEAVGDLTITYSFALSYVGVSKWCTMGEHIDVSA